jgi:hypothetical protein
VPVPLIQDQHPFCTRYANSKQQCRILSLAVTLYGVGNRKQEIALVR